MATKKTPTKSPAAKRPPAAQTAAAKTPAVKAAAKKPAATKAPVGGAAVGAAAKSRAAKPSPAKPAGKGETPLFPLETVGDIAPLAEEAMKPVEAAVTASKETLEAVVKAGTQAATKGYEQAVAMTQEQVEKASFNVFSGYDEVANLGKDNMDAYVASSAVVARGFESFGKEVLSFTQISMEAGVAVAKSLAAAKTLQEVIDLQNAYSRHSFDSLVAESAKLTDLSIAMANDAMEPLQSRMTVNVEKLMKPLAA